MDDIMMAFLHQQMPKAFCGEFGAKQKPVFSKSRAFVLKINAQSSFLIPQSQADACFKQGQVRSVKKLIEDKRGFHPTDLAVLEQFFSNIFYVFGEDAALRFDLDIAPIVYAETAANRFSCGIGGFR